MTSQADEDEDEDEDGNDVIRLTRKRTKKGIPEGFVRNGMCLILKYVIHLKLVDTNWASNLRHQCL